MNEALPTEVGTLLLNGEPYRIIRDEHEQAWQRSELDEPPYTSGTPPLLPDPMYTWHLGGFKSRPGVPGTSEYGHNSDTRFANELSPSPKINSITLTSSATPPTSIFEAMGWVFVCCGRRVYRINPSTDVAVLSKDFGASVASVMGMKWEEDEALVTTDEASGSIYKLMEGDINPGGPDNWTNPTNSPNPYRIAATVNRLLAVTKTGELKNVGTGLDPLDGDNYADSQQCGDLTAPNMLIAYDRTALVGKRDGVFGVGDDGFGVPVIRRMAREDSNCFGATFFDPYVLIPHVRGLYRYMPGSAESIGLEKELINESPVIGRWNALVADSFWVFGAFDVGGTETYICWGKERSGGEPGFGPVIWDTWLHFSAVCKAVHISALSSPQKLYFGSGNNLAYVELDQAGRAVEWAVSADRYMYKQRFDDWGDKDFPRIEIVGKNLDATTFWVASYSIDGAAFLDLDVNGAQMKLTSDEFTRFFLPSTAVGREIQWKLTYTGASAATPGKILYFNSNAVPRPRPIPVIKVVVQLEDNVYLDDHRDDRTAEQALDDLLSVRAAAASVSAIGPWSTTTQLVNLTAVDVVKAERVGSDEQRMTVALTMQVRETA